LRRFVVEGIGWFGDLLDAYHALDALQRHIDQRLATAAAAKAEREATELENVRRRGEWSIQTVRLPMALGAAELPAFDFCSLVHNRARRRLLSELRGAPRGL
jgi:hypothetical protein